MSEQQGPDAVARIKRLLEGVALNSQFAQEFDDRPYTTEEEEAANQAEAAAYFDLRNHQMREIHRLADALARQVEQMRPVVEAAVEWESSRYDPNLHMLTTDNLVEAVQTWLSGEWAATAPPDGE